MGGNCNTHPASSHVGIRHMARDRRMSGQNSDRDRETSVWQPGENLRRRAQL